MLVDTHIHLQDYKTKEVKNLVKNEAETKVTQFINPSANPADWDKVTELARQYPQITPAYGIHPWYIAQAPENWAEKLENLLQNNPKAMVGECGIDHHWNPSGADGRSQEDFDQKTYEGEREITPAEFRKAIGQVLPKYMIPSDFRHLAELPRGGTGKIDRALLNRQVNG